MAAENIVIGFPRWTTNCTFSGGSWNSTYPVTNLNTLPLAKIARSASLALAATQFIGTFDQSYPCRLFAFVRHTASLTGEYKLTLYADENQADAIYTGDWEPFWPEVYSLDDLEWEDQQWWSGQYSSAEIDGAVATLPIWLSQVYNVRSFKVEIRDPDNADGYFDLGMFDASQGWQLSIDPAWGVGEYGFLLRTIVKQAIGGVEDYDRRRKPRAWRGEVEYLPRDEVLNKAFELVRQHDRDIPFLWLPHPTEPGHWLRTCFLATNEDPGLFRHVNPHRNSFPIHIKEVL